MLVLDLGSCGISPRAGQANSRVTLLRLQSTTRERQKQHPPLVTPRGSTRGNFPSAALPWCWPRIRKWVSVVNLTSVSTIFSFTVGFWQVSYYCRLYPGASKYHFVSNQRYCEPAHVVVVALGWYIATQLKGKIPAQNIKLFNSDDQIDYLWTESFEPKCISLSVLWIKQAVGKFEIFPRLPGRSV